MKSEIHLFGMMCVFFFLMKIMFSLRCRTSKNRVARRCATGDGCPHLTTEHGHSMSQQVIQSTGIKIAICPTPPLLYGLNKCRSLSCSGIALSFLFTFCHFLIFSRFPL